MSYSALFLSAAQTKGQYSSVTPVQVHHLGSLFSNSDILRIPIFFSIVKGIKSGPF